MSAPNLLLTVESVRKQYPTVVPLGNQNAWRVCNEVAYLHRAEGWGLRKKPAGNNYVHAGQGYAIDIVFHKPSLQLVDCLGSSETEGIPQWNEVPGAVLDEWASPINPDDLDDVTPPIPPGPQNLEARVSSLEGELMRFKEALTRWIVHE